MTQLPPSSPSSSSSSSLSSSSLLQFTPLPTSTPPSFWHSLTTLKLDQLRLREDDLSITGQYGVGKIVLDRLAGKGKEVAIGSSLTLSHLERVGGEVELERELEQEEREIQVVLHGSMRNFNTAQQFTLADKNEIFNLAAQEILDDLLTSPKPLESINRFILLAFADLKKFKFYHWAAVPALVAQPNWQLQSSTWRNLVEEWAEEGIEENRRLDTLVKGFEDHSRAHRGEAEAGFCLVRVDGSECHVGRVEDFQSFFADIQEQERTVLFLDPSSTPSVPGWPLRNFLALLSVRFQVKRIRVICWRDALGEGKAGKRSIIGSVFLPASGVDEGKRVIRGNERIPIAALPSDPTKPMAIGWERNTQGKLAPKVADLGPLMDPRRLADQAVDLNLKLMRWRIMPEIQLEKIAATRCLLLGAGTLGCYVARVLMGWGVRNITLVDSSRVSYSNPVRQPLFEFEDCLDGGKPKAECAAERLKKIFPGVNAKGVQLSIPMPGHGLFSTSSTPTPESEKAEASAKRDVEHLERLLDTHDAVFLLMDSRESRWLPTLLGSAKNKIVINAALGFDTYLVMRHGAAPTSTTTGDTTDDSSSSTSGMKQQEGAEAKEDGRLGCYFCNDVVAPSDSLTDRTLDQMCTVTRPGLAAIAGASAVELLVSLVQHPQGVSAPAPNPKSSLGNPIDTQSSSSSSSSSSSTSTCLGLLPHQLRSNLSTFQTLQLTSPAYPNCTACSRRVIQTYLGGGWEMLRRALQAGSEGTAFLENLSGLDILYAQTEALLEGEGEFGAVVEEWSEEDDEEEEK